MLFFIHGWPDTANVWQAQLDYFSTNYYCVAPHLPNYRQRENIDVDFDSVKTALATTIEDVLQSTGHTRLILICHDWGALFGYLLQQELSQRVQTLVTIDVGANFEMENWRQRLGILFYQYWLIAAFGIGKIVPPLGDWLTQAMVVMFRAPRTTRSHSEMNYLYWYFWRHWAKTGRFAGIDGRYRPDCPLLYLYGKQKPFHLHTTAWIQLLKEAPDCDVMGLETDHWVMVRDPDATNRTISQFLTTTQV